MNRFGLISLACLILTIQAPATENLKIVPTSGDQALQFMIARDLTLDEFEGSMLSYRRVLENNFILQFGLGVRISNETSDRVREYQQPDTSWTENTENGEYHRTLELNAFLLSAIPNHRAWLYYGAGPFLR